MKPVPIKYTGHPLFIQTRGQFDADLFYTQLLLIFGESPLSKIEITQEDFFITHQSQSYNRTGLFSVFSQLSEKLKFSNPKSVKELIIGTGNPKNISIDRCRIISG